MVLLPLKQCAASFRKFFPLPGRSLRRFPRPRFFPPPDAGASTMDPRSAWKAFAGGDIAARDLLLTENLSLVHHVARQLGRKLTNELDHDELVSAGTIGLMAALGSVDPDRGLAFSTFACPRIRGAILDELRRQDHVPRSVRRKTRDIQGARAKLAAKLCRVPSDTEVADALGVDVETLWKWESDVEGAIRVPIDRPANDRS